MKKYIIWYRFDGEMDYTIITAESEEEARRKFWGWHSGYIDEMHEIQDNERYLEYC